MGAAELVDAANRLRDENWGLRAEVERLTNALHGATLESAVDKETIRELRGQVERFRYPLGHIVSSGSCAWCDRTDDHRHGVLGATSEGRDE
jgi:hypothetical protein